MFKWAATSFLALLFLMSVWCPLSWIWRGFCILLPASPAFDEVDDIACLAGGCSSYMEGWPVVILSNVSPI